MRVTNRDRIALELTDDEVKRIEESGELELGVKILEQQEYTPEQNKWAEQLAINFKNNERH